MEFDQYPDLSPILNNRYFKYDSYLKILKNLMAHVIQSDYSFNEIGRSVLDQPIYGLQLGSGKTKILMWSQMHGNESTTTRSLLLFINWFKSSVYAQHFKLYIIPVLNPDGLTHWSRYNANRIDLNRDAQQLSQPESIVLRSVFDRFNPDYCFNLHDQRTIYGSIDGLKAMQCSFLSPAANQSKDLTNARLQSMQVINDIVNQIGPIVDGAIGRYNDDYNSDCVGDTFQSLGVPTILFEAGQSSSLDYKRTYTVQVIYKALIAALESIATNIELDKNKVWSDYQSIPTMKQNYCDIWIKNAPSINHTVDLIIMYRETLIEQQLYFVPTLSAINDTNISNALQVFDCNNYNNTIDITIDSNQIVTSNDLDISVFK